MFDIGWSEFLVIGVVALIAIGPKELPGVLRTVGLYMGKIRRMAAEFQGQFQEVMREADMADLKKEVDAIKDTASGFTSGLHQAAGLDGLDPMAPASDPIPAGPPPPLAETQPDAAVPLPAPAEQQALPPPEVVAPAPEAAPPPAADLNIPLPEPPAPVTEKDFAVASTAPAAPVAPAAPPKPEGAGA
jgi:sec-independent protein translocase protein TatB